MADLFTDTATATLGKVLDGTATRQRVLANNIANADTPGFTRSDVVFEDQLRDIITQPGADQDQQISDIGQMPMAINEDTLSPRQADGNNVDMEREMVAVAKNSLQYESAAQLLNMKFSGINSAISEAVK